MKRFLIFLAIVAGPAFSGSAGEWQVNLLRSSTTVPPTSKGATAEEAWAACIARIPSSAPASVTYTCQTPRYVAVVTPDPPPPTCTSPQPPDETRPQSCPVGTTGNWSQSRTYSAAAYPTCWTAGEWTPTSAPAGACVPIPPPTCTAPKPADKTQTQACPTGTTGQWTQTSSSVAAPYPTCWVDGEWTPTSAPAGACTVIPPDPVPPGAIIVNPGESISAAVARLLPGGTVIVKPGTYSAFTLKACTATAWCTVKAETDGTVVVTGLSVSGGPWYTSIEGMTFSGGGEKSITASYVKFLRDGFTGGPMSGNVSKVTIGTNDHSPGADHILLEDCWVYGPGGRYSVLVYNASNIVLRRVVTRFDGFDPANIAPEADIAVYDSQNVAVLNAISVDTVTGKAANGYMASFYNVSNGTGLAAKNIEHRGGISINPGNYGMGSEGNGAQFTGLIVSDLAVVGGQYGLSQLKGSAVQYARLTVLKAKQEGFYFGGSSATLKDSVFAGAPKNIDGISCTNCDSTQTVKWITTPANGRGASILKRVGVSGTLYGEPGYNTLTDEDLWPYPNEARIKADFDSVRPAFGGKTLTNYVWEQLGNARLQ